MELPDESVRTSKRFHTKSTYFVSQIGDIQLLRGLAECVGYCGEISPQRFTIPASIEGAMIIGTDE
jgi:hypothetical protein